MVAHLTTKIHLLLALALNPRSSCSLAELLGAVFGAARVVAAAEITMFREDNPTSKPYLEHLGRMDTNIRTLSYTDNSLQFLPPYRDSRC